jgi:hypothetical protein
MVSKPGSCGPDAGATSGSDVFCAPEVLGGGSAAWAARATNKGTVAVTDSAATMQRRSLSLPETFIQQFPPRQLYFFDVNQRQN